MSLSAVIKLIQWSVGSIVQYKRRL